MCRPNTAPLHGIFDVDPVLATLVGANGQMDGSHHVLKQFAWLEVCSGKMALPRPAHPRVTQPVGQATSKQENLLWHKLIN